MKNKLSLLAAGFVMGLTHFIPGTSGGTVGIAANMYRETTAAIANIREYFSQSMKLLLPLILGMLAAILLGATVGKSFLTAYEAPLRYFFLGTVFGCLPLLTRRLVQPKWDIWCLAPLLVGVALMLSYYFWTPEPHALNFRRFDAKTFFILFGSATFGTAAILLPGLNTVDMVYLFHADPLYQLILTNHEIFFLLPILCGCALGFIGTAWLITIAYAKRPQLVDGLLLAFLLGSLPTLIGNWSSLENKALCLLLAAVGAFIARWTSTHLQIVPKDMVFQGKTEQIKEYHIQEYDDGLDD